MHCIYTNCVFPVLYTGYKDLKSEKTKDKSHTERCMLTICVYGYLCTKEGGGGGGGVGSFHKSAHAHLQWLDALESFHSKWIMYNQATSFHSSSPNNTHTLNMPM